MRLTRLEQDLHRRQPASTEVDVSGKMRRRSPPRAVLVECVHRINRKQRRQKCNARHGKCIELWREAERERKGPRGKRECKREHEEEQFVRGKKKRDKQDCT
eukprot:2963523-Pleurochrysis_carterae.AAC.1